MIQVEQIGIQQAARQANNPEALQSMQMVNQMMNEQRQSATAFLFYWGSMLGPLLGHVFKNPQVLRNMRQRSAQKSTQT